MNNFITIGGSIYSPSLRLGSSPLTLSASESKLLQELIGIYEAAIGGYDIFEVINIEFEQSGQEHSKRVFVEWAKARCIILADQYERQVSGDVWNDGREVVGEYE